MKKLFFALICCAMLGSPAPVAAQSSVVEAQAMGLVGVTQDGLLGIVSASASPDVQRLVAAANAERMATYRQIAQDAVAEAARTGSQLSYDNALIAVQRRAAAQLRQQLPRGQYFQNAAGRWQQK